MFQAVKITHRQAVFLYAKTHGLSVSGSQSSGYVAVIDKQGHFSEAWSFSCQSWQGLYDHFRKVEQDHAAGTARPWEAARKTYANQMKPQTKVA